MSASKSHLTPAQVFGLRVRETRMRRGLSQRELAERLHVDRTTLNKIEKGARGDVAISQLFEFAKVLRIAPVHLLTPRLDDAAVVLTEGGKPMTPRDARRWIRGYLTGPDLIAQFLDLPPDEQRLVFEQRLEKQGMTPVLRQLMDEERMDELFDQVIREHEERKETEDG